MGEISPERREVGRQADRGDGGPTVSDEQIEETVAMVRDALDLCDKAQLNGDLDEARFHLGGALDVMQPLAGSREPKLLGILGAIDVKAEALDLLPAQLVARSGSSGSARAVFPPTIQSS